MGKRSLRHVEFRGPVGRIEAQLHVPAEGARFAAVVSHPHPLHGGTMANRVVYRVARTLEQQGALVLRYNFRGVGRSEGTHDGGDGEQDDLRSALAHVRASGGAGLPTLLAGFSFGSVVSGRVALADPSVDALLLVGLPVLHFELSELTGFLRPMGIVQGSVDEHGPLDALLRLVERLPGSPELRVVEGADHLFASSQGDLAEAIRSVAGAQPFREVLGLARERSRTPAAPPP